MKIIRINNQYSSVEFPSIHCRDLRQWFLDGKLHRPIFPAVETQYTKLYYHRGIMINKKIAEGKLLPQEILKIENMEIRQAAMEILGYEKFFEYANELHRFTPEQFIQKYPVKTNPMYTLYQINCGLNEQNDPVKILVMNDPSKFPYVKYFIRVHPDEIFCELAVAHSYEYSSWEEYIQEQEWV